MCHLCWQSRKALTVQAETADQASVNEGMNIPEEIARREERLKVLAAAKETIEARAQERFEREQAEYQQKTDKRAAQKKAGQKPRGSESKPPQPGPKAKDQVNLTDEESRIMPVSGGGFEQCYNAQASVDTDTMLVVSEHMSQAPNDKAEDFLADTGYFSTANVQACITSGIKPSIATGRDQHNLSVFERFVPDSPAPDTDDPVELVKHRLTTHAGRALYGLRKQTVEPVFGIIKQVMGFRQFSMRGIEKVAGEWTLVTLAWNLKRMNILRMT